MDSKGFISIDYIFSLFLILIIACGILVYASASAGNDDRNHGLHSHHDEELQHVDVLCAYVLHVNNYDDPEQQEQHEEVAEEQRHCC